MAKRRSLYQYCVARGILHKQCGKLVVATTEKEDAYLEDLKARADENDVVGVELIGKARLKQLEPHLRGSSALTSSTTGIIDCHSLMISYQGDAEEAGAVVALGSSVLEAEIAGDKIQLRTAGPETAELEADLIVNCAGMNAWEISRNFRGLNAKTIPPRYLAKGSYFSPAGQVPFRHLIYPVPEASGLVIHLTFDLYGQAWFGPDVQWVDHEDYLVDLDRSCAFYVAIRRYWPALPDGALLPAYSGIRPKTTGKDQEPGDFVIQEPAETGHPGYIALYGIDSPGLTSSLAIADYVAALYHP